MHFPYDAKGAKNERQELVHWLLEEKNEESAQPYFIISLLFMIMGFYKSDSGAILLPNIHKLCKAGNRTNLTFFWIDLAMRNILYTRGNTEWFYFCLKISW